MRTVCRGAALLAAGLLAAASPAFAQPAPSNPPPPAAQPDPAFQAAKAAFDALAEPERRAIQDALVWTGDHVGVVSGSFGRRTFDALAAYGKRTKASPHGVLDPKARGELVAAARRAKEAVQFTLAPDLRSGVEIGVPQKLLPKREGNANGGTRWQSADGRITLDTRAQGGGEAELAALYERYLAIQAPGREVTYKVQRPDFFVVAGETATGKFYTRAAVGPAGIRGFSIGYDKALTKDVDRAVVAIANSFVPFPAAAAVAKAPPLAPVRPPAIEPARPERPALPAGPIATGLAIAPRRLLTGVTVEACPDLRAARAPARLVKADRAAGLAVLETEASRTGAPVALRAAPLGAGEEVVILAYAGGTAPTDVVVSPGEAGPGPGRVVAPLQPGAAGAPVFDRSGALAGLVGPMPATPRVVAGVVPPASHPVVPAEALAAELSSVPQAARAEGPLSAGAIAARLRPFLVPIVCAP
jgi:hypothetical protein